MKSFTEEEKVLIARANQKDYNALFEALENGFSGINEAVYEWGITEGINKRDGNMLLYLTDHYEEVNNYPKAMELLTKSSEFGNRIANVFLGDYYRKGEHIERNFDKAYACYQKAIKQGEHWDDSPNPMLPGPGTEYDVYYTDCGIANLSPKEFPLEWWLYVLAKNPTPVLKYELAQWYWEPIQNQYWSTEGQMDKEKALKLMEEAANEGSKYARCKLAQWYSQGEYFNKEQGLKWLKQAAEEFDDMKYLFSIYGETSVDGEFVPCEDDYKFECFLRRRDGEGA